MDKRIGHYFLRQRHIADCWDKEMERDHAGDIRYSVEHARIYPDCNVRPSSLCGFIEEEGWICELKRVNFTQEGHVSVVDSDTVSAVMDADGDGKLAVLNFASYWHPGGGFKEGYGAQEEMLCLESTLYQVLSRRGDYYRHENASTNGASGGTMEKSPMSDPFVENGYCSDFLYTPDIVFARDGAERKVDVITCAAPNWHAYWESDDGFCSPQRWKLVEADFQKMIRSRIRHILAAAHANGAETLILGAWGCGMAGNDPGLVAEEFKRGIEDSRASGRTVKDYVFAIPNPGGSGCRIRARPT